MLRAAGLVDRLPGDRRRLAPGEQPAAGRGDQRQPDQQDQHVGQRHVTEHDGQAAAGPGQPGDHRARHAKNGAEQAERGGRRGGDHPPGRATGAGRGDRAQVLRILAADELASIDELRDRRPTLATVLPTRHLEGSRVRTSRAILLRAGQFLATRLVVDVLTTELVSACFDYPVAMTRLLIWLNIFLRVL